MKRWPLVALALGWLLAAVAIGWSGYWVGHTNRYDDCAIVEINSGVAYLCPILAEQTPAIRPLPGGGEA